MMAWTSSGSRRSDIAVNPETSVNMTVTCLRSPSTATRDVGLFSARGLGVELSGEAKRAPGAAVGRGPAGGDGAGLVDAKGTVADMPPASLAPHSPQNL